LKYKLIAVDLDDSLLGSDLEISQENKRALFTAREKGVLITVATGRMLDSALPYIKELNIDIPVITYQGAYIKDTQTGETLVRKPVPRELAAGILEECKKLNLHVQFYNENSYFFEKDNEFSRFYQRMTGIQGKETENLLQLLEREEPIKLLVIDNQDRIREMFAYFKELFGRNLQISFSRPEYLEFTNAEATKGNALAVLGQMLDISREEIIAIGDSHNDISMIEYAGLGIAMGNAIDELKHHADYVTKGNDENGVAEAVERFILKKE
jgi:Cof subfamily protein (haloacid dehalogenase superfamily)